MFPYVMLMREPQAEFKDSIMSDWAAGYIVDVDYTHGFYPELAPSQLNFGALLHGIQAPDLAERSLSYCELGCGQGFSTNLLAAANPHIQFYATDFNPAHIAGARALAQGACSTNIHFFDDSFADFLHRKDLPDFDFITLHGIYSCVTAGWKRENSAMRGATSRKPKDRGAFTRSTPCTSTRSAEAVAPASSTSTRIRSALSR